MNLPARSNLRNPLFTPRQCNWMEPVLAEGKVIGSRYCPKDVWAEYRICPKLEPHISIVFDANTGGFSTVREPSFARIESGGYYCPAHFMRMLAVAKAIQNGPMKIHE